MIKKIRLLLIFILAVSCGYEPMLSKKNESNYNFLLKEILFEGDKTINLKVKEKLNNYRLKKTGKVFMLKIISTSSKKILAKNIKGDPTNFKNISSLYVEVLLEDKIQNILKFEADFNYNNSANKFDLKNYEKDIKRNLAETMTSELILKLSNIQ